MWQGDQKGHTLTVTSPFEMHIQLHVPDDPWSVQMQNATTTTAASAASATDVSKNGGKQHTRSTLYA